MPYIPQFNKISLQEAAYAPSYMRQQQDEAVTKSAELADALKFDYLKQDASVIEPTLQKYDQGIKDVSSELAKSGFTQDTKSKILGLRANYIGDDKIRHIKKNYADATSQWDEQRKRMIQEGRPGSDIENQKQAFFSGYQGGYSSDGYKNDFTPGATSGYYDIGEDAKKAMTNIGQTGTLVGNNGTVIGTGYFSNPNTGKKEAYYSFTDRKTGQKLDNLTQEQAVQKYLEREYTTPGSDRNRFAQINKIDPEFIKNTIGDVAASMRTNMYHQIPSSDTRMQFAPDGSSGKPTGPSNPFMTYDSGVTNPDMADKAAENKTILDTPIPTSLTEMEKNAAIVATGYEGSTQRTNYETKLLQGRQVDLANKKQKIVDQYKKDYPQYYKDPNADPIEATKRAIIIEKNNSASVDNDLLGINVDDKEYSNVGLTDQVLNRIKAKPGVPLFEKQEADKTWLSSNTLKTKDDYIKTYDKSKLDWKTQMPMVNNNGDVFVKDPSDKLLKVNPEAFDNNTKTLQSEVLKPVLGQLMDVKLFDDKLNQPIPVPNTDIVFDVEMKPADSNTGYKPDPYKLSDRIVHMYRRDPQTGQVLNHVVLTPMEAKQEIARGMFQGFENTKLNQ